MRDIVDVVTVHETILPLGAVVWAAVEKAPGYTPEGLIAEIRSNSNYPASEWRALASTEPIDANVVMTKLRAALDDAEAFVSRMPTDKIGLLFFQADKVVQPDPDRLDTYQTHAGQTRGHWPTSPEITAAMFERYNKKPNGGEPECSEGRCNALQTRKTCHGTGTQRYIQWFSCPGYGSICPNGSNA